MILSRRRGSGSGPPGFRELEEIGAGGHAVVYRAHQERFDRTVALKVLNARMTDRDAVRRFERECALMGKLGSHPNIVTIYDSGTTTDRRPFLAMEYASGGSLADALAERGSLEPMEAISATSKIADALAEMHSAGVVHRDVKPSNILVSKFGEPMLADFGISLPADLSDATLTTESSLTVAHASPEVLEGGRASPASDVYSLGSTLYQLLTGRAPFARNEDEGSLPLLLRVLRDPVPAVGRSDVPDEVEAAIGAAMSKAPAERPTAAEFGAMLRPGQGPTRSGGVGSPPALPPAAPRIDQETVAHHRPELRAPEVDQSAGPTRRPVWQLVVVGVVGLSILLGGIALVVSRLPTERDDDVVTLPTLPEGEEPEVELEAPSDVVVTFDRGREAYLVEWSIADGSAGIPVAIKAVSADEPETNVVKGEEAFPEVGATSTALTGLDPALSYCFTVQLITGTADSPVSEPACVEPAAGSTE